jgi:GNAT superfamily N-acetyltransferase
MSTHSLQPQVHIQIANTTRDHCRRLADLQPIMFPNLHPSEWLTAEHFLNHLKLFPEGQFVALANGKPVGSTTTFRLNFDFDHPHHSFLDITDNGWLENHEIAGEWLYGADISVHPDYRGYGIAKKLYAARTQLCERLNLRGQIAGGYLPGYAKYSDQMNAHAYCMKVVRGELTDPTLSAQLKMGYRYIAILEDYYHSDDYSGRPGALIVKDNHRYMESE